MEEIKEIWKKVPKWEDYEVSNLGRVRSWKYYNRWSKKNNKIIKEPKILKASNQDNRCRYPMTVFSKTINGVRTKETFLIHILVAKLFLGYIPKKSVICVNHIDGNKFNNKITNLEVTTHRENLTRKSLTRQNDVVIYVGVSYEKGRNRFKAQISLKNEQVYLGIFSQPEIASLYYIVALINKDWIEEYKYEMNNNVHKKFRKNVIQVIKKIIEKEPNTLEYIKNNPNEYEHYRAYKFNSIL